MCGQLGVIYGRGSRSNDETEHITRIFTDLMVLSESRGHHATGVAWVNRDGGHKLSKKAIPASEFVCEKAYREVLASVDNNVTILMGHTRWPTVGNASDPANAQPIRAGMIVGTTNGTITNADQLFKRLKLPRHAEVDSEVIFRIADTAVQNNRIDTSMLCERLSQCRGQMSTVIVSKTDPETVIVVKGNKPLEFIYHKQLQAIVYASDARYLQIAVADSKGWERLPAKPMRIYIFQCADLPRFQTAPLSFTAQVRCNRTRGGISDDS